MTQDSFNPPFIQWLCKTCIFLEDFLQFLYSYTCKYNIPYKIILILYSWHYTPLSLSWPTRIGRRYLRTIWQYREQGCHVYYLDETWINADDCKECMGWFNNNILPWCIPKRAHNPCFESIWQRQTHYCTAHKVRRWFCSPWVLVLNRQKV